MTAAGTRAVPTARARRAVVPAAALALALTLTACGGEEDEADPTDPAPTATAEPEESGTTAQDGSDAASDGGTVGDGADEAPSDGGTSADGADEAPSDDQDPQDPADGEGTPGGIPPVSLTWPAGWVDLNDLVGPGAPGTQLEMFGVDETIVYPAGVLTVYDESMVAGRTFEEMVVAEGADPAMLAALPEREVAGQTVSPFEVEIEQGGFELVQRFYPLDLGDGRLAAITFTAFVEDLPDADPVFDALLDSVALDG